VGGGDDNVNLVAELNNLSFAIPHPLPEHDKLLDQIEDAIQQLKTRVTKRSSTG
jgi:hypothetical protein